mgnify:CR=1 FL=1
MRYRESGVILAAEVVRLTAERDRYRAALARLAEVERDKATAVEALRSAQRDVERWEADWQTERRSAEEADARAGTLVAALDNLLVYARAEVSQWEGKNADRYWEARRFAREIEDVKRAALAAALPADAGTEKEVIGG